MNDLPGNPGAASAPAADTAAEPDEMGPGPVTAEQILVVDDTPANLRLLSQMLAGRGYRVRVATSGARALASTSVQPPDLILLDIRMNGMSGFEVCDRLKGDPRTADIPVLFISALTDLEDKMRAFAVGGVDYVTKPFHVEEVLARVETHLALRRLQARLLEANKKMARELALAGKVQCGFLPRALPAPDGWQLAAALRPAQETSGDFYDAFTLPDGRLALILADVVDKGVAAALFMALSLSLLRTCALTHPDDPAQVCRSVNERLLQDAHTVQFITVFYGILDPATGYLAYCNAGQNVPFLVTAAGCLPLAVTGPPLGVLEEPAWWQTQAVLIPPEGTLVLYSDGVHEAENERREQFGLERLQALFCRGAGLSARALLEQTLAAVGAFAGGAPQTDDIALLLASRER